MMPRDDIPYRRWFPWLHLFKSIDLALSIRQMILAAGSIVVLWMGHGLIDSIATDTTLVAERGWEISEVTGPMAIPPFPARTTVFTETARPWEDVLRSGMAVVAPHETFALRLKAILHCCWSLAAWSLFGLMMCRLAARRLTRNEEGSFRKAIQYGVTRWIHGVVAPLLPAAAAGVVMVPALVVAVSGRLPWIGPMFGVISSPFVLFCNLIAAILLIAVFVGWPLMLAAIGTDDCDGFGGLSRSYSLWTGRPWYFGLCVLVAAGAGMVVLFLANALAYWTLYLSNVVIQVGMGDAPAATVSLSAIQFLSAFAIKTYFVSFFWTNATIVYVLLRQSVDGLPLDSMSPDDDERPKRDPFPVVGMPAMSSID